MQDSSIQKSFREGELRPVKSADDSPIFIIGTGRSGTTLLRQMMNAHPRIHITHEASFYSYARHAPPDGDGREWLERYFDTFSFRWLRLDPAEVRAALPQHIPLSRVDEICRVIMRLKAQKQGKVRYGEKNPLDTHNLQRIFADFADPRVIYITRDPRPTMQSFGRMPFGTSSSLINSILCKMQFDHVEPYLDRILEVRLEDLAQDPRAAMSRILQFVGEPWDDAVLDHVSQSNTDDVPPLPWFVGATREQPSKETSGGGWRTQMDPSWIRIVERMNEKSMRRYGYEPANLAREPGFFDGARALINDLPGIFAACVRLLGLKRTLDRHFQGKAHLDAQAGMEANLALNPGAWRHYPAFTMPHVPPLLSAPRDAT